VQEAIEAICLVPPAARHAWNALQIGNKLDLAESRVFEQRAHSFRLALAYLENKKPSRRKKRICGGYEAPIDIQAIFACKEREGRLVVANFDSERIAVCCRHIGRIGNDQFKRLSGYGTHQIALQEPDSFRKPGAMRILPRYLQRGF
jgi:hypothetical protein